MEADIGMYSPEEVDRIEKALLYSVLKILKPFDEYVNVTSLGGTPYEAVKKEFGL